MFYNGRADAPKKHYGNMVASCYPVEAADSEDLKASLPWPQLVAHVLVEVGGKPVHVITAHVPNGAGNGWAKIDTFRAIAELVRRIKGAPCLLTGDFNEPQFALQDGRIVTFGQDEIAPGQYRCWRKWEFDGRTGTGEEWDAAVRWLFEGRAEHGLRHAYWEASGYGRMEPSHISRGNPRWFDHIFFSEGLHVESCFYLHKGVRFKVGLIAHKG